MDYRVLNKITVSDIYPILNIEELLEELYGAMIFLNINLTSGYHQIRMHQEGIVKSAFQTHSCHYEFIVIPFGLTNSLSTFQGAMN